MADKIDEAIAAADAPQPVKMVRIPVQLSSTGRPAGVDLPADATDAELVDLAGWLLTAVRQNVAANRGPKSRLMIPGRIANA